MPFSHQYFLPLVPFSLCIVSTTLTLVTTTSKHWARQRYYDILPDGGSAKTWKSPMCSAYRSPFYRCGFPQVQLDDTTKKSVCDMTDCKWYKPYGTGKTSCQSAAEYGKDSGEYSHGVVGTDMECQFVHYAGNLQIAAAVFITLSLLLLLAFISAHFFAIRQRNGPEEEELTADGAATDGPKHRSNSRIPQKWRIVRAYFYKTTVLSLWVGAILQFLAQFFGILGLTVVATGPLGDVNGGNYGASTWSIDLALARYGSAAWLSALVAAGTLRSSYRHSYSRKEL